MTLNTRPTRRLRALAAAALAALALVATSACSIQIRSAPDPSIPDDTMLIAADNGSPLFDRAFNPYFVNKRVGAFYVYEPLVILDNLTGVEHPWLASDVTLPDARTVQFTLREGVTWSDGQPFTADDVAFTFDLLKQHPELDLNGVWTHIDSIETAGSTVTVHLLTDDVPAASIIGVTLMVPEHIWSGIEDPATYRDPDPVGTGPYTLGAFAPQQYSLDKNHDYWQADTVAAEHLVLPAKNTQLDIATKGYDWGYSYLSDVEGSWVAAGNENTYWFPPGGTITLFPNLTRAPFTDLRVRTALSESLDRDRIASLATEGYMQAAGQTNILLPNQEDRLDPGLPDSGRVAQDTQGALALFAEAGYTQQDGRLVGPDGAQLSFTITTANGYTDWLRAVQEVQKQWGAIGIDVTISAPQPAAYQSSLANGEFDMAMGGIGGTGDLYRDFATVLSSDFLQPIGTQTTGNYQRFSDPAVDALLAELKTTIDPEQQRELGYELQRVVYDQVPVIAMYYGGSWGLFSDAKFTGWPSAEDPYASPKTYDSTPLLILTHLEKVSG
ncbi:ABC transporter substrate-binding protein [Rathayibacter tanaceti]|uniref:ABC transporter substrate-binding protein n=2 Tax=Rathayibacter tanaceti TaxID=1671680 RepID=A0A166HPK4_9MICO|nr:ABC transporter substrate-binding protein [Rathayibacter tanaceti]KZX20954.1 Oligopeptide-binding protein AppA precursor [Rathayibacter tanaceti]QHC56099.1 ABC transporter substrate-binding protein [Rathayibacter tanaceti]TCO36935.1 peptide/nickel transport system substrate-binding protein [Rathayibacter tanaceti]